MAAPYPPGRMICKKISRSKGIAKLSPEALALFCMILPHLDSYGKANGNPMYIKAEMVPLIPWLDLKAIIKCLAEIDANTNIHWFRGDDGTPYIHATHFGRYQKLRDDRLGNDSRPSFKGEVRDYSGTTPGVVPPKRSEVEVKDREGESTATPPAGGAALRAENHLTNSAGPAPAIDREEPMEQMQVKKIETHEINETNMGDYLAQELSTVPAPKLPSNCKAYEHGPRPAV